MHAYRRNCGTKARGTSLIELLVVIVVLLIGILGVIQVFPGGFQVLRTTRNNTIAQQLAEREVERMAGLSDQLPEEIRTTVYTFLGSALVSLVSDPRVTINSLATPDGSGMDSVGNVFIGNDNIGNWAYVSGANLMRRIIGEGGPVPSPLQVGNEYGSLMVLHFSPIVYNPTYPILLQVYGNDMVRRWGYPGWGRSRSYIYYVGDSDSSSATISVPRDTVKTRNYRLEFTAWLDNGGVTSREIETVLSVAPNASGGYVAFDFASLPALTGLGSFLGVDFESVRLARSFDEVSSSAAFSSDPYEYVLLDSRLGVLLFNPNGYNYLEQRSRNRRIPLVAKVNYDVFDWRIIHDEFRVPGGEPNQIKLILDSIKVRGNNGVDGNPNRGLDIAIPNGNGGPLTDPASFQYLDVVVVDLASGAVLLSDPNAPADPNPPPGTTSDYLARDPARTSYVVDKSAGFLRLLDYDRTTPGLQVRAIYPGTNTPVTLNADGRLLRALYQGNNEFAAQAMKAPSRFRQTYGAPQVAEYYIGQTGTSPMGQPTRIYFPNPDGGKNVTIGEVWYRDAANNLKVLRSQNYQIATAPFDPAGPYVDIRSIDPGAVSFDFSDGYAVRNVRGASVRVRVLWNPDFFNPTSTQAANWERFIVWTRSWRGVSVESFLQKGENP